MFSIYKSVLDLVLNPVLLKYLAFGISYFFGIFLFWRAAKRELVDTQVIFDVVIFSNLIALIGGRLADFFLRPEFYQYSLRKLIFFNAFAGLDFIGAFLGLVFAVFLYTKIKKTNFWYIFDFVSVGITFSLATFNVINFLIEKYINKTNDLALVSGVYGLFFFAVFWSIKRLEKKKRHKGFFAFFFLSCFFLINTSSLFFAKHTFLYKQFLVMVIGGLLIVTIVFWYLAAKRKLRDDIKALFASVVLVFMKALRVLTNVKEADGVAKSIVLSPLYISKLVIILVKYLGREFTGTFIDVGRAFGVKK